MHTKLLVIENAYLIIPLINSRRDLCQQMFKNLFELSFSLRKPSSRFKLDRVNSNALFNDRTLVKDFFLSFIGFLMECEPKDSNKFLRKCIELINSDFHEDHKRAVFDSKKFSKIELSSIQVEIFQMFAEFIPIEYLDLNYGLICFLLNQKVNIKLKQECNEESVERFCFNNYTRLAQAEVMQIIPIENLESWIIGLFDSLMDKSLADSNLIFNKVIRKSVNLMVKDTSHDYLSDFVEKVGILKILIVKNLIEFET